MGVGQQQEATKDMAADMEGERLYPRSNLKIYLDHPQIVDQEAVAEAMEGESLPPRRNTTNYLEHPRGVDQEAAEN